MKRGSRDFAVAGIIGLLCAVGLYASAQWATRTLSTPSVPLDRIVIIVLEDFRSNKVDPAAIGPEQLTPFLNKLAREHRVATNFFGVWKPSLPNYIAMIAGDYFGINNNDDSCYNPQRKEPCNRVDAPNLVDQLEKANISWEGLFESMPSVGYLGSRFPADTKLYAQKHNPLSILKALHTIPVVSPSSSPSP